MRRFRGTLASALVLVGLCATAPGLRAEFSTDVGGLSDERRAQYLAIREMLSDRDVGYQTLFEAYQATEAFMAQDSEFLPIHVLKARALVMLSRLQGGNEQASQLALDLLRYVQTYAPGYAESYALAGRELLNRAENARRAGNKDQASALLEQAQEMLEKAVELNPENAWAHNHLSDCFAMLERYGLAYTQAEKALHLAKDDAAALVAALSAMYRYANYRPASAGKFNIPGMVYKNFHDPLARIEVAERIIDAYRGNAGFLRHAYMIIMFQKRDTPELPEADLQMVRYVMNMAETTSDGVIARSDEESAAWVESQLDALAGIERFSDKIFIYRMRLAVGTGELERAEGILQAGISSGKVSSRRTNFYSGYLHFARGDYAEAMRILGTTGFKSSALYLTALSMFGTPEARGSFFRTLAENNPDDAWALGSYADYLLEAGDVEQSIGYGQRAVDLMPYRDAVETLALAYLLRAGSRSSAGDEVGARSDFVAAKALARDEPIEVLVGERCASRCGDVAETIRRISN